MKSPGHLRIEEVRLKPGQEWVDDADAWRFVRVGAGAAYWLDPAAPRAFTEGELLVLSPGSKAVVRASQLTEVVLQGFKFAPDSLLGFFTMAERQFFEHSNSGGAPSQFLPSTHPLTQHFAALLTHRGAGPQLAERVTLLALATAFLGGRIHDYRPPLNCEFQPRQRFHLIISQMPDAEFIRYSPEQLAALCGCSTRHFNRLFQQQFGEAPRIRQTKLRLLKARQALANTDTQIRQVALDCGYRSLSLFNSLFKRRIGMSPSQWRRQMAPPKDGTFQTLPLDDTSI